MADIGCVVIVNVVAVLACVFVVAFVVVGGICVEDIWFSINVFLKKLCFV